MSALRWKEDKRPKRGSWAPGNYFSKCMQCDSLFVGDKRALWCADCAYKDEASDAALEREKEANKLWDAKP